MAQGWKRYRGTSVVEVMPYDPTTDDLKAMGVYVSPTDTPQEGGMIARNPENHADKWYINEEAFKANYKESE